MAGQRHTVAWVFTAALAAFAVGARTGPARQQPPTVLPPEATAKLAANVEHADGQPKHPWAAVTPTGADGTVVAYIEIPRGDRRKWELDMRAGERVVNRLIPADVGGYPVNYGFVPQTVFVDGDPFDALVLGPPVEGGSLTRGVIVGVMFMDDEGAIDSKVVLSPAGADGKPLYALGDAERSQMAEFFRRYKQHEGGSTGVTGWGSPADGLAHVRRAHAFYLQCQARAGSACDVSLP